MGFTLAPVCCERCEPSISVMPPTGGPLHCVRLWESTGTVTHTRIQTWNDNPSPLVWTTTAQQTLAGIGN
jgi:hypothetical protein